MIAITAPKAATIPTLTAASPTIATPSEKRPPMKDKSELMVPPFRN
jgi:hypothetical protein